MPTSEQLCFVIGPIGRSGTDVRAHADWLLDGIIRPVMKDYPQIRVKRADEDARPGQIDAQMITDLLNAELVIADMSLMNPNAYYEIGIRHMVGKPIIHMQLASEEPAFDTALTRAVRFSRSTIQEFETAKTELKRFVEAVLAPGYQTENPVTNVRGRLELQEHATSEQKIILSEVGALRDRVAQLESMVSRMMRLAETRPRFDPRVLAEGLLRMSSGTPSSGSSNIWEPAEPQIPSLAQPSAADFIPKRSE